MASLKFSSQMAWAISAVVALLAILAWGQGIAWNFSNLSVYRLFPVFGLLAFSLMWSVYIVGLIRRHVHSQGSGFKNYYQTLSLIILVLILLHPSLLIWRLWLDGFGLPPGSYKEYVGPSAVWAVVVSSLAFLVFMAYELRRLYRDRAWWKYVETAGDIAIIGIFFHALRLGNNLQEGWFKIVWFFYGALLLVAIADSYKHKLGPKTHE